MGLKLIFRTKLDDDSNYQGVELLDSQISLSAEDLIKIKDVERKMYNSQSHLEEEEIIELSIGIVKIKGSIHPSAPRRRMIEGFIEVQEVIEQEPVKVVDNRAKELFINSLIALFALRQISDEEKEKFISPQIDYVLNKLKNENSNVDIQALSTHFLEFLKDNSFKEDIGMRDIITCIQSNITF